jgi:hypothetical protein
MDELKQIEANQVWRHCFRRLQERMQTSKLGISIGSSQDREGELMVAALLRKTIQAQ